MIHTSAKNLPALKPRLRLGGLVKDWAPPAPVVAEIPAGADSLCGGAAGIDREISRGFARFGRRKRADCGAGG